MRVPRLVHASACLLAAGALLAGCGGDSEETTGGGGSPAVAESRPAPPLADFPSPEGRTLGEVLKLGDKPSELVLTPEAMVFYPGENRFPFMAFERDGEQVTGAELALYFARVPAVRPGARSRPGNKGQVAKAEAQALEEPAIGPFPARIESLAADPAFRAESTSEAPEPAAVVYSAELDFPAAGEWRLAALVREGDELGGRLLASAIVDEFEAIPRAGERPPRIHTPTAADAGGDLSQLTTRVPPDTQNKVDYADVLGKEPVILLFATPRFCQSQVCAPVVDVTEQAKQEYGDEAAFIHMEIWENNDPADGVRPQVRAFHLPSEPWLFAIDQNGVVRETIEGAFGTELLDKAIEKAIR